MSLEYSIVGFLDILGFSAMVESDCSSNDPKYLPIFIDVFERLSQRSNGAGPTVRMFSDSILVEANLSPENVAVVVETAAELQRLFLGRGILLRGGIAFGKHFTNSNVTFSQGLVSAYQIESKIARFPRIVIDSNALNYAWHDATSDHHLRGRLQRSLLVDRDGAIFVNYLTREALPTLTEEVKACIKANAVPAETVLEKMRWLLDYHNYCARTSNLDNLVLDQLASGFNNLQVVH